MTTNNFIAHCDTGLGEFDSYAPSGTSAIAASGDAAKTGAKGLLISPDAGGDAAYVQKAIVTPWAANIVWVSYWLRIPYQFPSGAGPIVLKIGTKVSHDFMNGNSGAGVIWEAVTVARNTIQLNVSVTLATATWYWVACQHQLQTVSPYKALVQPRIYNADGTLFASPSASTMNSTLSTQNTNPTALQIGCWNQGDASLVNIDEIQVTDTMPTPPGPSGPNRAVLYHLRHMRHK